MVEAKKKPSAIPQGLGGDSLIVEVIENKYHYHLPLYRQSLMLEGYGASISDITLGNWVSHVGDSLLPLYDSAWKLLLSSTYLQVDETPIKILKPDKQGYLWTYFAPLIGQGLVLFEASLTRSGEVAKQRLASFNGLLQTDGYNGYQALRKRDGIVPLGCLTHARRKFKEVVDATQDYEGVAAQVIASLKPLYALEEHMRQANYPFRARKKFRKKNAKPVLKKLYKELQKQAALVPPKSKLGLAIAYALNQWRFLTAYVSHGWAQIDTNWVENQIRPIAVGKKNWLFMGHQESAKIHALFYSLVLSAYLNGLNPRLYLHYLLSKVHELRQKKIDPDSLLPHAIDTDALQAFSSEQLQQAKIILSAF